MNGSTTYLFLPFRYRGDRYIPLVRELTQNADWEEVHDDIRYMFRYIADKMDSLTDRNHNLCFHFALRGDGREKAGLGPAETVFETEPYERRGVREVYGFRITGAEVYCFNTGVGLFVWRIGFDTDDAYRIAAAEYYLKKISRQTVSARGGEPFDLLRKAKEVMAFSGESLEFYYDTVPGNERANIMTYLEVGEELPDPEAVARETRRKLYFLRYSYIDDERQFIYWEDDERDREEVHKASPDIYWGLSRESMVCLAYTGCGREKFICEKFRGNTDTQYRTMYVLLLHQKYVLRSFYMEIGTGMNNRLPELEDYRARLYEFETDFEFASVTEVEQYQSLYDKAVRVMELEKMYKDVREPLVSLNEVRKEQAEKEQNTREDRLNRVLTLLSILSVFSALVDGYDLVTSLSRDYLNLGTAHLVTRIFQLAVLIIVSAVFIRVLIGLRRNAAGGDREFRYLGCFLEPKDVDEALRLAGLPERGLPKRKLPHVTFVYKPTQVDRRLFGQKIRVRLLAYGNDGENEGFLVSVEPERENAALSGMIDRILVPHITLATSETGQSENTSGLVFDTDLRGRDIVLTGTFGGFDKAAGKAVLK